MQATHSAPRPPIRPRWSHALLPAVLVVVSLYFSQSLYVGLTGEDLARSAYHTIAAADRIPAAVAFRNISAFLAQARGGWFPLADLVTAFWFAAPSPILARLVQFTLVLADFAVFWLLATRLLRSATGGALAVACTLCATVYEKYHDPVLGRTLEMPLLVLLVLGALLAWTWALDRPDRAAFRAAAMAAYAAAALYHPAAYFAGAVFVAAWLVHERRGTTPWWIAIVFPATALFFACIGGGSALARVGGELAAGTYARHAWEAVVGALPFVYRANADLAGNGITEFTVDVRFAAVPSARIESWIIVFSAAAFAALALRDARLDTRGSFLRAAVVGGALWIAPALQLGPGDLWPAGAPFPAAFPAVELERFGVGLLIAALALRATTQMTRSAAFIAVAVPLLIGTTLYGNQRANLRVVDREINALRTRALLDRGAAVGLFDGTPEGARIALDGASGLSLMPGYDNARYAFFAASRKRYTVVPFRSIERPSRPTTPTWIYRASGASALATLVRWTGTDGRHVYADAGRRFSAPIDTRSRRYDRQTYFGPGRGVDRASHAVDGGVFTIAERTCGPVDRNLVFVASGPVVRLGPGFIRLRHDATPDVLAAPFKIGLKAVGGSPFAGNRAELDVVPDACPPSRSALSASIFTPEPAIVRLTSRYGTISVPTNEHGARVVLVFPPTPATIAVRFDTDAPPARLDMNAPRIDGFPERRITMLVGALDTFIGSGTRE